jgi:hypothetical protein
MHSLDDGIRLLANTTHDLVCEALSRLTERQRSIFLAAYAVDRDGQTSEDAASLGQIGQRLGLARSTVYEQLAVARATVFEHLATRQVEEVERRVRVMFDEPLPTISASRQAHAAGLRPQPTSTHPGYTRGITLGEGSEQMVRAAKYGGERTRTATIRAHQQYVTRDKPEQSE